MSQPAAHTPGTSSGTVEPPSPAHTRQLNAHRAANAAQALQLHTHISGSTTKADNVEEALIELLIDLHHLCDTCDLDLAPLLHTASLVHASETRAA